MKNENKINSETINQAQEPTLLPLKLNFIVMSNKGGIGKSEISIALTSALRNQDFLQKISASESLRVAAFTGDTENWNAVECLGGDIGDPFKTIVRLDLNTREGADDLLNMVVQYPEADVLLNDFPSNSLHVLGQIMEDPQDYFETFHEQGYKSVVILPLDAQPDSLASIVQAAASFGPLPHYVVAINLKGTHANAFKPVYDTYCAKKDAIFKQKTFSEWEFPTFEPEILAISKKEGKGTVYKDIDIHPDLLNKKLAVQIRHRKKVNQLAELLKPIFDITS